MIYVASPLALKLAPPRVSSGCQGFSLVEALIASVVIAIAVAATVGGFSAAINFIGRTGNSASQASVVEADIAQIGDLSVRYSACTDSLGSLDPCPGQAEGNSFYYFPENSANSQDFYDACNSASPDSHITKNFIDAINTPTSLGAGVARLTAVREDPTDSENHIVVVSWSTAAMNPYRVIKIAPVVSSWCP